MKNIIKIFSFLTMVFVTLQCNKIDDEALRKQASAGGLQPLPLQAPGAKADSPEIIALGKKLYNEKALSKNDTQSCASCHSLESGGADPAGTATSKGAFGKFGDRNAPTVFNAAFHFSQFWDGRAADLEEQAKGPILNPVEMAMDSEAEVVEKLKQQGAYTVEFAKAFPQEKDAITYDNIAKAIAAFERTLVTRDRFDDYLEGDNSALNTKEKEGLQLFLKTGCTACHNGPAIGGGSFQKMGALHPYENTQDLGRFAVTKKELDKFMFKVPSLRNIADTAPYFNDGKIKTLQEAVQKMAYMQIDIKLSDQEADKIAVFLQSLSGKVNQ